MSKLTSLEMGRGVAACMVVLDHANASTRNVFGAAGNVFLLDYGKFGVDFFFVLSGFVIVWSHWRDIGKPGQIVPYLLKRGIRLYPIAWLVVGFWLFAFALAGRDVSLQQAMTSLLFIPSLIDPIPTPVWTLRHELLFYFLFASIIVSKALGAVILGGWAVACGLQAAFAMLGKPWVGLGAFALSSYHFDFLLGGGLAYLHRNRSFVPSLAPLVCALGVLAVALLLTHVYSIHRPWLSDYVSFAATGWTIVLGLCFAGVVHGLVVSEGAWSPPRMLGLLGASSYAIYLSHIPVISLSQRAIFKLPELDVAPFAAPVLFLLLSCCVGAVLHVVVEQPTTATLRRLLLGARA